MFVALDFVWDKAKENRTVEKAIYIDECWQLIGASSNRLAAEFVLEIFKIIRGYGGSAICATQDINDFFALEDGKYGKGIINNAKTKIVLNLEEEEARRVQILLHLSEAEVMEITHFERGNGLISTNNNNVTVEIKCSQLEKELITTDRRELVELLLGPTPLPYPGLTLAAVCRQFREAGFTILQAQECFRPIRFFDVGALVWFARVIEWEFPGFSVDACAGRLLAAQQMLERDGCIEGRIHRILLAAAKP